MPLVSPNATFAGLPLSPPSDDLPPEALAQVREDEEHGYLTGISTESFPAGLEGDYTDESGTRRVEVHASLSLPDGRFLLSYISIGGG